MLPTFGDESVTNLQLLALAVGLVRDQAQPDGLRNGITASLHVELLIDGLRVKLDSRRCNEESLADLFI